MPSALPVRLEWRNPAHRHQPTFSGQKPPRATTEQNHFLTPGGILPGSHLIFFQLQRVPFQIKNAAAIGFDGAFQYEDFARPLSERRIKIEQVFPEIGKQAYRAWMECENRHPY